MAAISFKALAADANVPGVKKTDLYRVDPKLLTEEPGFNLRDYTDPEVMEHIEGFAYSYEQGLYVPPLVVRTDDEGRVTIIEGHCRRLGALLAIDRGVELAYLDCVPFRGGNVERVEVMLRSAEGLKLKTLAVALGYLRLTRLGYTTADIAKRLKKSRTHVEQLMLLATANADVHELVRKDLVSAYAAIEALREHGEKTGEFLARKLAATQGNSTKPVTTSAVRAWAPTRNQASQIFGSVTEVVSSLDKKARRQLAELEKLDPSQLKGKKVEVDASALLALYSAHLSVSQAKAAKDEAQREAQERAKQHSLDIPSECR